MTIYKLIIILYLISFTSSYGLEKGSYIVSRTWISLEGVKSVDKGFLITVGNDNKIQLEIPTVEDELETKIHSVNVLHSDKTRTIFNVEWSMELLGRLNREKFKESFIWTVYISGDKGEVFEINKDDASDASAINRYEISVGKLSNKELLPDKDAAPSGK